MHAAVVRSFDTPPTFEEFPTPIPEGDDEMVVDVVASALHPRVRSQANGSHYTSTDHLPLVPGIDGVGTDPDGTLRYFLLPDTTRGAMAERTVVDRRRSIVLSDGSDPILVAAAMNPAMSSWVALRRRGVFEPGQSVLVIGATGSAGQLAVQIARHLGAGRVIGAGRDPGRLAGLSALGVDTTVSLHGEPAEVAGRLGSAAADVDLVIDYVWGQATADAMAAIVTRRSEPSRPLTWIEIGSVGGATAPIPSAALRAARLQIVGSGQGSVAAREFVAELPELAGRISDRTFTIEARSVPLRDVHATWSEVGDHRRIVFVPSPVAGRSPNRHPTPQSD